MANPAISMPDTMLDTIDRQPGINRSGWVREAIDRRLYADTAVAEFDGELPDDWWEDAVDQYLNSIDPERIEVKQV